MLRVPYGTARSSPQALPFCSPRANPPPHRPPAPGARPRGSPLRSVPGCCLVIPSLVWSRCLSILCPLPPTSHHAPQELYLRPLHSGGPPYGLSRTPGAEAVCPWVDARRERAHVLLVHVIAGGQIDRLRLIDLLVDLQQG